MRRYPDSVLSLRLLFLSLRLFRFTCRLVGMSAANEIPIETVQLIERARAGDQSALADLFERYRERLRRMVDLRLDRQLAGRVDPSDVLQEAFIDLARKLKDYDRRGDMPFFLWLRLVTGERLLRVHRKHLTAGMRDARREFSLGRHGVPGVSSILLAGQLVGPLTSAANKVIRAETQAHLQNALNSLDEIDREVIALRHFEELSNVEVARVLDLSATAASNRYIRAIRRLKESLNEDS